MPEKTVVGTIHCTNVVQLPDVVRIKCTAQMLLRLKVKFFKLFDYFNLPLIDIV